MEKRATIQKKIAAMDKERKEAELRALAQRAREDRGAWKEGGHVEEEEDQDGAAERDELRQERKRERERERRLENKDGKRSRMTRDAERDVSERIALGQAVPNSSETLYDQRLFNQSSGLSSGLGGADDSYNIYDKALFRGGAAAEAIYRPTRSGVDEWADEEKVAANVEARARFKPGDKGFEGAKEGAARSKPVEFEEEEEDPFGLDQMLTEARKGSALDKIGEGSGMSAAAGGSMPGTGGGSGRSSIGFARESRP